MTVGDLVKLRNGATGEIISYGPLTKSFFIVRHAKNENVMLFKSGFYRLDEKEHPLDIMEIVK